jgi:uridine kinase
MREPPEYAQLVQALTPVLHNLPGKIVSVDGRPGVGKTTLGRFLAWRFNVTLVETDLFLIERQGRLVYREDEIARIIEKRLRKPRPVIVDGAAVLRLLASIRQRSDFAVYVTHPDAPESHGTLADDLAAYDAEFSPRERADCVVALGV